MKPLDLFGSGLQSYSAVVSSQRRLNCFYDLRQDGDKYRLAVVGTPGTVLSFSLNAGTVRGWWVVGSTLYVVAGRAVYTVDTSGIVTQRGLLNTTSGKVGMADNGTQVIIVDGTNGYILTVASNALTQISDGNFPNGATSVAFLDGRFFCEQANSRQFWQSAAYDGTNWTPATFGTKENNSDQLRAVSVWNGMLVLWGYTTMEFWQDVGTSPLIVGRINGATQAWGLAAAYSKLVVDNKLLFLGARSEGGFQIAMVEGGYTPVPVSTSDIDAKINTFSTVSDAVALTYVVYGHPMYQITFPTAGYSFIYDLKSGIWSEVQTGTAMQARHYAELGITFNNITYVSDYSSGRVYKLDVNTYTDYGTYIKRQVRTKHIHTNGDRFTISRLFVDMESGVGLQNGQGSDPTLIVQTSKDGGRTFGNERYVKIGKVGQYTNRVNMRRFGQARDFVFQFTMTDPVKFIILSGSAVVGADEAANG